MNQIAAIQMATVQMATVQMERARTFAALHAQGVLLPNAWDAASARIFELSGYPALGTTSAGIAYSRGRRDGQALTREEMLREVANIVGAVNIPVNADIEAGYGDSPADVALTATAFVQAGAVGLNLEDAAVRTDQALYPVAEQQRRLEAARKATDGMCNSVYLTARTDTYLTASICNSDERFAETVGRGRPYLEAGADCVFVPLLTDLQTLQALRTELGGPLAVMAFPGAPGVTELLTAGASRVSTGQGVMLATLGLTARIAYELQHKGTYSAMQETFYGFQEAEDLFV